MPVRLRRTQDFVQALQQFHSSLPQEHQAMLDSIISAATEHEASGYLYRKGRTEDAPQQQDDTSGYGRMHRTDESWTKLAAWLDGSQGQSEGDDTEGHSRRFRTEGAPASEGEDTQGYGNKWGRTEDAPISDEGEDTQGYGVRRTENPPISTEGDDTQGFVARFARTADAPTSSEGDDTEGNMLRRL